MEKFVVIGKLFTMEDNDDTESQQEMEEKGYTLPEYAFTVECNGVESGESSQLDVLGWIQITSKKGIPRKCHIIYPSGKEKTIMLSPPISKLSLNEKGRFFIFFEE